MADKNLIKVGALWNKQSKNGMNFFNFFTRNNYVWKIV